MCQSTGLLDKALKQKIKSALMQNKNVVKPVSIIFTSLNVYGRRRINRPITCTRKYPLNLVFN